MLCNRSTVLREVNSELGRFALLFVEGFKVL